MFIRKTSPYQKSIQKNAEGKETLIRYFEEYRINVAKTLLPKISFFYSDRGIQYTPGKFHQAPRLFEITQSMGGKGKGGIPLTVKTTGKSWNRSSSPNTGHQG